MKKDMNDTLEASPENLKINQEQIESACMRANNRPMSRDTRPISFDAGPSFYIDDESRCLQMAPTPPPVLCTIPDLNESAEDPVTAIFRPKSPSL